MDIYPQRLGQANGTFSKNATQRERLKMLGDLIRRGLRALRSGNLLTGQF